MNDYNPYFQKILFGVNGVTFPNEEKDGGKPRQEILKELYNKKKISENSYHTVCTFKRDDYEGEFAVKVLIDNTVIGYVPRTHLYRFQSEVGIKNIDNMKAKVEIAYHPENKNLLYALIGI